MQCLNRTCHPSTHSNHTESWDFFFIFNTSSVLRSLYIGFYLRFTLFSVFMPWTFTFSHISVYYKLIREPFLTTLWKIKTPSLYLHSLYSPSLPHFLRSIYIYNVLMFFDSSITKIQLCKSRDPVCFVHCCIPNVQNSL